MITLTELRNNYHKTLLNNENQWFPVNDDHKFEVGDEVRTPDGLVRIVALHPESLTFYGTIITPIHDNVVKGETYEYRHYETQVLAQKKDKRLVKTAGDILKKSKKQKQKKGDDDMLQIDDADGRHKSPALFNPITINPILDGVLSKKEIKVITEMNGNNLTEGITQSMIRGLALAIKRKAMNYGKQMDSAPDVDAKLTILSKQNSAIAALALLAVSVSGDGVLSKAGIVSGLFSG